MQVRPILYTVFIALGFALLANTWVVKQTPSATGNLQKSSLTGFNSSPAISKSLVNKDTFEVEIAQPDPVKFDTSDVAGGIQDLIIEARIKKQLFKNATLRAANISVNVAKGRVVLEGTVASQEVKRLIETTVVRVKGVVNLESNIKHA